MSQQQTSQQQTGRVWHRSQANRMIAGVCGGLAESFGIDPVLVRVVALVLLIPFNILPVLLYAALWLMLPVEQ
jgi:phage shock protein PspC (stress-responsive transcriptional regulator)